MGFTLLIRCQAYSSAPPLSQASDKIEAKEDEEFGATVVGNLVGLGLVAGAGYGFCKYIDWSDARKRKAKKERESRESFETETREQLRDLDTHVGELQNALMKLDPCFWPGEAVREAARAAQVARNELESAFHEAELKSSKRWKIADSASEDPIERLAARLVDPTQRELLRESWKRSSCWKKEERRKLVQEKMGVYGIQWPEKGSPYGDDDDE
ncbi:MAG: hypothetical protein L6R38_004307 [Xanthoria sp. 2 TBL-2021]|nr:MAG: hypothetical protein L6R38_004307 [Xanthoria sp. 2 TBL-2021]